MLATDVNDVPNVIHGQLIGVEAAAIAAVDLQIEERRCYPAGLNVRRLRTGAVQRLNDPMPNHNIDQLGGDIMSGSDFLGLVVHLFTNRGMRRARNDKSNVTITKSSLF